MAFSRPFNLHLQIFYPPTLLQEASQTHFVPQKYCVGEKQNLTLNLNPLLYSSILRAKQEIDGTILYMSSVSMKGGFGKSQF